MKKYKVLLSLFCIVVFVFLAVGSTGNDEEPVAEPDDDPIVEEDPVDEPAEEVSEIEEYYDEIYWNTRFIGEEFTWLGEHFGEYDGSEQWYDYAEEGILEILYWIEDAEEHVDPPAEAQEHYDLYMEALNKYRKSMNVLLEALEGDLDEAALDEAMEYMDQGSAIIDELEGMEINDMTEN